MYYLIIIFVCSSALQFYLLQKRPGLVGTDPEAAAQTVSKIKGHLVEFPSEFLKNQELLKTRLIFDQSFFQ